MKALSLGLLALIACACHSESRAHMDESPSYANHTTSSTNTKLAQEVRNAISNDTALSYGARNVSVLADDGVVTLRGSVASSDEKARVEDIAKRCAGVRRVDNQLEVRA